MTNLTRETDHMPLKSLNFGSLRLADAHVYCTCGLVFRGSAGQRRHCRGLVRSSWAQYVTFRMGR